MSDSLKNALEVIIAEIDFYKKKITDLEIAKTLMIELIGGDSNVTPVQKLETKTLPVIPPASLVEMTSTEFISKLKTLRGDKTQGQVGAAIGRSASAIYLIESKQTAGINLIKDLANFYKVKISQFDISVPNRPSTYKKREAKPPKEDSA